MTELPPDIRQVALCAPDNAGRLIGKRVPARRWPAILERGGLAAPNFHLVTNLENVPYTDLAVAGPHQGFRNGLLRPLPDTAFRDPAEPGTLFVLADTLTSEGEAYEEAPRRVLARQVERLAGLGLTATVATELEFYLFDGGPGALARGGYRDLVPFCHRNLDNDVLLTARANPYLEALGLALEGAGIAVEAVQGEGSPGQLEVNTGHGDPLGAADQHVIFKHLARSTAHAQDRTVTFLAKPDAALAGSSGHAHLAVVRAGTPLLGRGGELSADGRRFVAGLLAFTPELALLHAPYANSYKRLVPGSFTPLKATWGHDNRTCLVRVCGDERGTRLEFRLAGADANPYHLLAAILIAGLAGLTHDLPLPPSIEADAADEDAPPVPRDLSEAVAAFGTSSVAAEALGPAVHAHVLALARHELEAWRRAVTGWEVERGFDSA